MSGDIAEKPEHAGRPDSEFPTANFPTVFADGVLSLAPGPGIVKYYLYRVDPNMFGRGGMAANPSLQVVMPLSGFVEMAVFFEKQISDLISQGQISREAVDQLREEGLGASTAAADSPMAVTP
jgi:hypothetical protein